jgi:hypothetical protein
MFYCILQRLSHWWWWKLNHFFLSYVNSPDNRTSAVPNIIEAVMFMFLAIIILVAQCLQEQLDRPLGNSGPPVNIMYLHIP